MDDQVYVVPTFSWTKPKYSEAREAKLDYICTFTDDPNASTEKLQKVFLKKKHEVPGPEVYDMVKNWVKKSSLDFEKQRGRQYHNDRVTETAQLIKDVKTAKEPAPNHYKPKRQSRILGPANSKGAQMHMIANTVWYAKQTPGFSYKPAHVSR